MMNKTCIFLCIFVFSPALYAGVNSQLRQGGQLYQDKKYGAAINTYQKILKHHPQDQHALFNTGNAHYRLQEYTQAAENYKQAAQQAGDYAQHALYNLGNTYYRAGDKQKAIVAYKSAILQDPQDKEAIHNLQLLLQEQQNKNENQNNQDNQDKSSDNQSEQNQNNQGQDPQQQPQESQPQQGQLSKSDADRVMSMAKEQEYKPGAPADRDTDQTVEKDW